MIVIQGKYVMEKTVVMHTIQRLDYVLAQGVEDVQMMAIVLVVRAVMFQQELVMTIAVGVMDGWEIVLRAEGHRVVHPLVTLQLRRPYQQVLSSRLRLQTPLEVDTIVAIGLSALREQIVQNLVNAIKLYATSNAGKGEIALSHQVVPRRHKAVVLQVEVKIVLCQVQLVVRVHRDVGFMISADAQTAARLLVSVENVCGQEINAVLPVQYLRLPLLQPFPMGVDFYLTIKVILKEVRIFVIGILQQTQIKGEHHDLRCIQ